LIAKLLYAFTENQTKYLWDEKCQNAFDNLKRALTSISILSFPKRDEEFIFDTDASNIDVLVQFCRKYKKEKRKLSLILVVY